jgi:hypothetical protein
LKKRNAAAGRCWDCSAPATVGRRCERHAAARLTYEATARPSVREAYNASERGMFMRSTYEWSPRRYSLRLARAERADFERYGDLIREYNLLNQDGEPIRLEPIVPRQTVADINRNREMQRMIERAGGWDMYRVRLNSGL